MKYHCKRCKDVGCETCHQVRMCVVCGLPESVVDLARITWKEKPAPHGDTTCHAVIAKINKINDVLVCIPCIKDIKRIPFSDLPIVDVPF